MVNNKMKHRGDEEIRKIQYSGKSSYMLALPKSRRRHHKRTMAKVWARWLRNMSDPRPFVDGEDPLQGKRIEYKPGEPERN